MTKPHPHAALMLQYAQDAAETDKPWERWEVRNPMGSWGRLIDNPTWVATSEYRPKPKTIRVNGFYVPAPLTSWRSHETVWWTALGHEDLVSRVNVSGNSNWLDMMLARGILHATKEAALAHAKALLGIDPEGTV